ncbi:hypothetical protein OSB04_004294 [Centaurea solstitialis]|uniref:Uncharacterized protein n=1 Tax=Centaurea solstitialis TaxID=347529 RepID=A0AA38UDM1_9ASTR|nr:hypothetical protein OSB04_004294 [Centaurea solstitialis]
MKPYSMFRIRFFALVLLSNLTTNRAKPGPECSKTCGNLTIPFPFGIEENCYLDNAFKVTCNTTTGRVQIQDVNVDIVGISLDGHLRVHSSVSQTCYNETDEILAEDLSVRLSRFPISVGRNKITVLGCDTRGNIKIRQDFQAGCLTMPGSCNPTVGSCSSTIGCCQTTVEPAGLTSFRFHVESNGGNVGMKGFNNCSFAFIVEDGRYNFSMTNLYELKKKDLESLEMVLDWTVGNTSCKEAQKNVSGYLCNENSECFDASNGLGYRCSYVNECDDVRQNSCSHLCNNIAGSYTCYCPKGHSGDGRKDGSRCIRNRTNVQKLGLYIG